MMSLVVIKGHGHIKLGTFTRNYIRNCCISTRERWLDEVTGKSFYVATVPALGELQWSNSVLQKKVCNRWAEDEVQALLLFAEDDIQREDTVKKS